MKNDNNNGSKDLYYEDLIILEAKIEKAQEIAINLLNNLDFNFISRVTDLPIEEVQNLINYSGLKSRV